MSRKLLLKDTFTYKTVPYLVKVEKGEMYVHAGKGKVRGVNIRGHPTGMGSTPHGWKVCDMIVARVRPDYPYSIDEEWPENVDQHFKAYEPLEWPEKNGGWLSWGYSIEEQEQERDAKELAETAISKLKDAYENRERIETLNN